MTELKTRLVQEFMKLLDSEMDWDKAAMITILAHRGQKDKGGNSYGRHPFRVSESLGVVMGTEDEMVPTLLHDAIEDTDWVTAEGLLALGCTKNQVRSIECVTKPKDKSLYNEEIYFSEIEKNPCAARIKYLDMKDNARPDRLKNAQMNEKDVVRINGYHRNMRRLRPFIIGLGIL